jgi:hypothetical protein
MVCHLKGRTFVFAVYLTTLLERTYTEEVGSYAAEENNGA